MVYGTADVCVSCCMHSVMRIIQQQQPAHAVIAMRFQGSMRLIHLKA